MAVDTNVPYEDRVDRCIRAFDIALPDWPTKVDEDKLDMSRLDLCVWAMISGEDWDKNYVKVAKYIDKDEYYDPETKKWREGWSQLLIDNGLGFPCTELVTREGKSGKVYPQVPLELQGKYDALTEVWKRKIKERKNANYA